MVYGIYETPHVFCVVMDTHVDYVEGGYIHEEDCLRFKLLIGVSVNWCIDHLRAMIDEVSISSMIVINVMHT